MGPKHVLTRRQFLKWCTVGAASLAVPGFLGRCAMALSKIEPPALIWLEACTCTGNFLSFANSARPFLDEIIFERFRLLFSNTIMAPQGTEAMEILMRAARGEFGRYILVVEGTIPVRDDGRYCIIGTYRGHPLTALEAVRRLAPAAQYIVAAGTCAAFGGPFAAKPNPSGSRPVSAVLGSRRVICVPGCPVHPDWAIGTLTYLSLYGAPKLDSFSRPEMFYGHTIHQLCQRRAFFDQGVFARKPGEEGCMFRIGCKGPVTYADCPRRLWTGNHVNWPVEANTPCIGCTSPEFPEGLDPFFEHIPGVQSPLIYLRSGTVGALVAGATLAGLGVHMGMTIKKRRLGKRTVKRPPAGGAENDDHT